MMMWECNEVRPAVESRSDIQNVWTLLLFFAPSCLAVAALLVQYLVLHTPLTTRSAAPWDVNPLDVVVLQWWRSALGRIGLRLRHEDEAVEESRWRSVFDQFMLSLCDIQTGLGVAILGYGFASLSRGITAYDWWTIVGLAWLATFTNIAAMSCLRDLFRKTPAKRDWRLCLVLVMVVLLALCMIPIGRVKHIIAAQGQGSTTQDVLAANVMCFFPGRGHVYPAAELRQLMLGWGIIAAFLAVVVALAVVVMILERRDGVLRKWSDRYRGEMLESSTDGSLCARCEQRFILLVMRPFIGLWLTLRVHLDLLNSVLAEITCIVALFVWVSLRFWQLLQLQPSLTLEITPTFAHFIALVMLLAPIKPIVEHVCVICRSAGRIGSLGGCAWSRKPGYQQLPAFEDRGKQISEDTMTRQDTVGEPVSKEQPASARVQAPSRRKAPKHFKFYLGTAWFVKALPIVALSAFVQLVFMFVLSTIGGKPGAEVVLLLSPWYIIFAPLSVLLFILVAMITEERGGSIEKQRMTSWCSAAALAALSTAAAVDTVYGLGGFPMSYLGMAAMGLMIFSYLLYGCISKPGRHVKGKGTSGGVDEESALLGGSKTQQQPVVRIPVRRPKQLHGPSRRLGKQSMKSYGTMAKPGTK